ncbi:MAG: DNA-3-methyladenine glycosylase [Candidatus Gracilibacteria bacterium]|jgi:DNA-3-methyladenine glycosylase
MGKVLQKSFFNRDSFLVAEELLGKYICRKMDGKTIRLMVNEVEIYDGLEDKASHASRGMTERNKVMFGAAGYFYVYFVYGMYNMLNIVTREKKYPAAILIRGAGEFNGPGKLTKALKITKSLNNKLAVKKSGLWFEKSGIKVPKSKIKKTPRVGVSYAGPIWSKKLFRFAFGIHKYRRI